MGLIFWFRPRKPQGRFAPPSDLTVAEFLAVLVAIPVVFWLLFSAFLLAQRG